MDGPDTVFVLQPTFELCRLQYFAQVYILYKLFVVILIRNGFSRILTCRKKYTLTGTFTRQQTIQFIPSTTDLLCLNDGIRVTMLTKDVNNCMLRQ